MEVQLHNNKMRVSKFLKDVTENTVEDPDMVCRNLSEQSQLRSMMKGSRVMHFGAYRTDQERLKKAN